MRSRHAIPTLALVAVLPLTGCTSSTATTQDRIAYLRQVAKQGAEVGDLLRDQDAPRIDKERCGKAFDAVTRREDYPADTNSGGVSAEWAAQIREFFVDSCVSGEPKSASGPTGATTTTITTPSTTTTTTTTLTTLTTATATTTTTPTTTTTTP
jgi:hypothetical protein